MTKKRKITGDMTVQDILTLYPETHEVFMDWGLHCATCFVGAFESIEDGARAHGFTEEEVIELMDDLNVCAEESEKAPAIKQ